MKAKELHQLLKVVIVIVSLAACTSVPQQPPLPTPTILVASSTPVATPTPVPSETPTRQPTRANTATPQPTPTNSPSLTSTSTPFGGDQGHIVFWSDRNGKKQIYVMNSDGSSPISLSNGLANDYSPQYSPDGKLVAFFSDRDSQPSFDLFVMQANGSGVVNLTAKKMRLPETMTSVYWSIDGQKLAVLSPPAFLTVTVDGKTIGKIGDLSPDAWDFPNLSPDHNFRFDLCGANSTIPFGNMDLCLIPIAGGKGVNFTNSHFYLIAGQAGSWSPDGQHIVFSAIKSAYGKTMISVVGPDGSDLKALTDSSSNNANPSWQP